MIFVYSCDFSTGLDASKIDKCIGDPNADADNPVLKEEQDAQVTCYLLSFTLLFKIVVYCGMEMLYIYMCCIQFGVS